MEGLTSTAKNEAIGRPARMKIRFATRADAARLRRIYAYYVENTTVSFEYEAPSVAEMERRIAEVEGVYPFLVCVVEEETGKGAENFSVAAIREKAQDVSTETSGGNERSGATLPVASTKENAKNGEDVESASTLPPVADEADVKNVENGVGERIVGYALAHRAFERAAYSWVAETAVYVDRDWRRRGIGEALYSALIEMLEAQGFRTLYAVVVAENKASVEFHKRAGYREFATFKNAGWKFDRWLDVVWLERTLGVWREEEERAELGEDPPRPAEETTETERRNPAPTPIRPLADVAKERLTEICATATRRFREEARE